MEELTWKSTQNQIVFISCFCTIDKQIKTTTKQLRNEFNIWYVHEFITYIYILYYQSSINFQFLPNLAGFPDILN